MRRLISVIAICLSTAAFADETAPPALGVLTVEDVTNARQRLLDLANPTAAIVLDASCCKICSKGKACGDSCISRNYQCRKGSGCACDG